MVRWERRLEGKSLPVIGANCLDTPAIDVALLHQERDCRRARTWRMRAVILYVEEGRRIAALRPVSAHQHPRAGRNFTVLLLPSFDMGNFESEFLVGVPVCSPIDKLFQYQLGPRLS